MLRYAFGRFYFGVIGVLLFTLPVFGLIRHRMYSDHCFVELDCSRMIYVDAVPHHGWTDLVWQRGFPPYDYWPLGLALIAIVAGFEAVAIVRARHRIA